jgi:hypothetical protein
MKFQVVRFLRLGRPSDVQHDPTDFGYQRALATNKPTHYRLEAGALP